MKELFKFMEQNFWLFFGFAALWLIMVIGASVIYRSIKVKRLPKIPQSDLKFSEKGASGCSHRSLMTKFGGARNCLVVQLGSQGLIVRPFFPFNLMFLPEIYDLEHFIPRHRIRGVSPSRIFGRKTVIIDFETEQGQQKRIELFLHKHDEFLNAMAS